MKLQAAAAVFAAVLASALALNEIPERTFRSAPRRLEGEYLQQREAAVEAILESFVYNKDLSEYEKNRPHQSLNLGSAKYLSEDEDEDDGEEGNKTGPGSLEWATGMASGLAITLCSVCGVLLIPITKKWWYKRLLLYLIATATSSLMGNSLFQLMPPAFGVDMSEIGNIMKSTTVYVAFVAFFIIERILNIVFDGAEDELNSEHGHDNEAADNDEKASRKMSVPDNRARAGSTISGMAIHAAIHAGEEPAADLGLIEKMKAVKMVAWMLFIGDALENIADGLAMGAGFGSSIALGIGITIAIFSEEFPHKIGDFAIFLNAGMSVKMALVVNVISGATVWIGIVIGLILGENEEATRYIFAIAAGVFLYVGLGGLFPEMGETSEELQEDGVSGWQTLLLELLGLATGLAMMIVLCLYSDDIENALTN